MSKELLKEIEEVMTDFIVNSNDKEFWNAIECADNNVYSDIEVPVIELHTNISLLKQKRISSIPTVTTKVKNISYIGDYSFELIKKNVILKEEELFPNNNLAFAA